MRNAPVTADSLPRLKLLAGHRLSAKLPWYQGPEDAPMEPESQAIVDFVKEEIFPSDCAITLDCHSGFGLQDRLWFPYAKTVTPFPHIAETYALFRLFNKTYPDHIYKIEPQSNSYTTHGDLWDYLYDEFIATKPDTKSIFLPLCLEMGSWAWVRKNPKQLFSPSGPYNPVQPHRMARAKRRHLVLMDFLMRTVLSPESWASLNTSQLTAMRSKAMRTWY